MSDRRTKADRLRDAEKAGKIREHLYTYSPKNTAADTRHVIIDNDGVERVLKGNAATQFIAEIEG